MIEFTCTIFGNKFALKTSQARDKPPVLALHGWLDNAGSFDRIAPQLANYHVIAPDLAGHGLSDFRSPDSAYNLWQDVGDMDQLIRDLNFERVILMGHSRGAMIANMLAALYPEMVKALVLLDGTMPRPVAVEDTVDQMRNAFDDRRKYLNKPVRYYQSYEDAIQSRLRGPLGLSRQAIDILAQRGLAKDARGYYWRADPRLRGASEVKLTAEHSKSFIKRLQCPALAILANSGSDFHAQWINTNNNIQVRKIEASHHLHLEETCGVVADLINEFLERLERSA